MFLLQRLSLVQMFRLRLIAALLFTDLMYFFLFSKVEILSETEAMI